jgi:lipase
MLFPPLRYWCCVNSKPESTAKSMRTPTEQRVVIDNVEFCYFEWGKPQADRPSLLFVHATGFHARVWDYIIESFPDYHALAFEQRGHGRSAGEPVEHWHTFGTDLAAFIEGQSLSGAVGVGHSMGAHALVDAAALTGAFSRLLLIDPTIPAPQAYLHATSHKAKLADGNAPSSRRRNLFTSVEDMKQRLAPKGSFSLYKERIFDDYCRHGVVATPAGDYTLACQPAMEASVYITSRSNGAVYEKVRALDIPVHILRAQSAGPDAFMDFSTSPTWPGLVNEFQQGRETHYPQTSHFIPMEEPDEVIRVLREELR